VTVAYEPVVFVTYCAELGTLDSVWPQPVPYVIEVPTLRFV